MKELGETSSFLHLFYSEQLALDEIELERPAESEVPVKDLTPCVCGIARSFMWGTSNSHNPEIQNQRLVIPEVTLAGHRR